LRLLAPLLGGLLSDSSGSAPAVRLVATIGGRGWEEGGWEGGERKGACAGLGWGVIVQTKGSAEAGGRGCRELMLLKKVVLFWAELLPKARWLA
jgi:hypothetical protein